jgi:hypothetical protein
VLPVNGAGVDPEQIDWFPVYSTAIAGFTVI